VDPNQMRIRMLDVAAVRSYIIEFMLNTASSDITASFVLQFARISWCGIRM